MRIMGTVMDDRRSFRTKRFAATMKLAAAALLLVSPAGCSVPGPESPAGTFGLDFSMPTGAETGGAIVFYVDGLNAKVFQQMLEADELPAIKKYFASRGLYAPRAVANTPSVTLANLTSFVTGKFPGHHGVVGINWFDRNRLIWRNYEAIAQKNTLDGDYTAANIYEHFPDRTTFSIFFQPHRGTTKFFENRVSAGPPFFFGWYEFVDRLTLYRFGEMMEIARKRRELPAVTIAYLLAPDFRAYGYGVDSKQYREAIRHTDTQIGRVLANVERAGLLEKIVIILASDHGLVDVKKHFPIEKFLREEVGLCAAAARLWEQTPFENRLEYYRKFNCVLYGSGDRYWAVCLRKPIRGAAGEVAGFEPWPVRPSASDLKDYPLDGGGGDLTAVLIEAEAVDAIAYAVGENKVRVRRKAGEVEFRQPAGRGGKISCHLISGKDPLGWRGKLPEEVLNGKSIGEREWLELTHRTDFPDLPSQIVAYFRARRAGDIVLFAAPGWDFNTVNRAGHGGLRPGDMHVPLLLAGPGVPKGRLNAVRTADVMPTLLKLLGRDAPADLDGQMLIP